MNKKSAVSVLAALVVGAGGGYAVQHSGQMTDENVIKTSLELDAMCGKVCESVGASPAEWSEWTEQIGSPKGHELVCECGGVYDSDDYGERKDSR